jgi:hypothetical protein
VSHDTREDSIIPPEPTVASSTAPTVADPRPVGELTDVTITKRLNQAGRDTPLMLGFALMMGISVAIARLSFSATGRVGMFVVIVGTVATVSLALPLAGRWSARRVRRCAASADPQDVADDLPKLIDAARGLGVPAGLRAVAAVVHERGGAGKSIRIVRSAFPQPQPEPLDVPFQPQPLNEAHTALPCAGGGAGDSTASTQRSEFRRRVLLRGGWWVFALGVIPAALQLLASVFRKDVADVLMLATLVALLLFAPVDWRFNRQWFLVPGGVVLRKAGWRSARWTLHLFERTSSVLFVGMSARTQWLAAVADGKEASHLQVTPAEADLLLRAWLSSVPPPPIETLSDLE